MPSQITISLEAIQKPKRGRPRKDGTSEQRLQPFGCHISDEAVEVLRTTAERLQVSQGALIEAFARSLAGGQIAA